jgi:hypothetical protein
VDADEAESRLIADNMLRRQLNPMVQARLLQERVKPVGVRTGSQGKRSLDGQNVRLKDAAEAESRLIADNTLRRQLTLGEQARLIRRLKERTGVKRGPKGQGKSISAIIAEIPELATASERKQRMIDHANDLIPPLFDLFSVKRLPITPPQPCRARERW